jgi:hypothetical protein
LKLSIPSNLHNDAGPAKTPPFYVVAFDDPFHKGKFRSSVAVSLFGTTTKTGAVEPKTGKQIFHLFFAKKAIESTHGRTAAKAPGL